MTDAEQIRPHTLLGLTMTWN